MKKIKNFIIAWVFLATITITPVVLFGFWQAGEILLEEPQLRTVYDHDTGEKDGVIMAHRQGIYPMKRSTILCDERACVHYWNKDLPKY